MLKQPNAKHVFTEIEALPGTGGKVTIVLVVMTDLELDVLHPSHDPTKVNSLLTAVQDFIKVSNSAMKASIRTIH